MNRFGDLITVWNIIINNPLEKFTGTFAGDVLHYRIKLDIGTFQNFLQTVYFPAAFFCQAFAVTGDLTQFTLLPVRNIAGFQQTMPKPVCDPFRIFHVRLASWQSVHVCGVDNHCIQIH